MPYGPIGGARATIFGAYLLNAGAGFSYMCTSQFGVLDLVKLEVLERRPFGLTKTSNYTAYRRAFLFVLDDVNFVYKCVQSSNFRNRKVDQKIQTFCLRLQHGVQDS